jgi:hypothetical protein
MVHNELNETCVVKHLENGASFTTILIIWALLVVNGSQFSQSWEL